jgi:DNA topoisomerase IA
MNLTPNYFEIELAKRVDALADRCRFLETAIRQIRRAVEAPETNEKAVGVVHAITTRALRCDPITQEKFDGLNKRVE